MPEPIHDLASLMVPVQYAFPPVKSEAATNEHEIEKKALKELHKELHSLLMTEDSTND